MKGTISQTLNWLMHPAYADGKISDWAAFVVLVLLLGVLWNTQVVQKLAE